MAECELRIRYSARRARYILEIVSLDVMEVHQEQNNPLGQSMASQAEMNQADQPQQGIQSSKFSFDLEYDLCV